MPNFYSGKRVLVSGASGFIGSHLARALADKGARVTALHRRSPAIIPHSLLFSPPDPRIALLQVDINDHSLVDRTMGAVKPEVVFHLAAESQVRRAAENRELTLQTNYRSAKYLLESAFRHSPDLLALVVSSSILVYPQTLTPPFREEMLSAPGEDDRAASVFASQPYALSVALIDQAARNSGLPVSVCRLTNVYGPGDFNSQRTVPLLFRAIIRNSPLELRLSAGQLAGVRDFLYIDDAVGSYLRLGAKTPELPGQAFNFGTDQPITLTGLIKLLFAGAGLTMENSQVSYSAVRTEGATPSYFADWSKAKNLLGWEPKIALQEGLQRTFLWYQEFFKRHPEALPS